MIKRTLVAVVAALLLAGCGHAGPTPTQAPTHSAAGLVILHGIKRYTPAQLASICAQYAHDPVEAWAQFTAGWSQATGDLGGLTEDEFDRIWTSNCP